MSANEHAKIKQAQSGFQTRPSKNKVSSGNKTDWIKWIGLLMSLSGVAAWCAGKSYVIGYWNAAQIAPEIGQYSSQELAFLGFIGSYKNWFFLLGFFALLSFYVLLIEYFSTFSRKNRTVRRSGKLGEWLRKKLSYLERTGQTDPDLTKACAILIAGAVGLGVLVVLPLGAWIGAASADGHGLMTRQICEVRSLKTLPSTALLGNGQKLTGKFLLRNEKTAILLDQHSIYVITLGEKPGLQDMTDVSHVKCQ